MLQVNLGIPYNSHEDLFKIPNIFSVTSNVSYIVQETFLHQNIETF